MNKVYCYNCKYFNTFRCDLIKEYNDTPTEIITIYYKCEVLNKNNDCKYYKPNLITRIKNLFNRK
jgi:hypothetical protein